MAATAAVVGTVHNISSSEHAKKIANRNKRKENAKIAKEKQNQSDLRLATGTTARQRVSAERAVMARRTGTVDKGRGTLG